MRQSAQQLLSEYEAALSKQSWNTVADFIHDDAVFIFTEKTFRGRTEIEKAFTATFELIKDETYKIENITWPAITDHIATCIPSVGDT